MMWYHTDYGCNNDTITILKKIALFCTALCTVSPFPLDIKEGTIIEDSEINSFFNAVKQPVSAKNPCLKATKIYVIQSHEFNAFAVGEPLAFIFYRVIEECDLDAVVAILMHEMGHIAGQHVLRQVSAVKQNMMRNLPIMVLGAATLNPIAIAAGMGMWGASTQAHMMKHSREHEYAADAFAVRALNELNWPVSGLEKTMTFFHEKTMGLTIPSYFRTHPYPAERLRSIQAMQLNKKCTFPKEMDHLFQCIKSKLVGFCTPINKAHNRIQRLNIAPEYKLYGQAIVAYRKGLYEQAMALVDQFEGKTGGCTPYTQEIKADIALEQKHPEQALRFINDALRTRPRDLLLATKKASILLALNRPQECRTFLEHYLPQKHLTPQFWYVLARSLYMQKQWGPSHVCQAEQAWASNDKDNAKKWLDKARPYFQKKSTCMYGLRFQKMQKLIY